MSSLYKQLAEDPRFISLVRQRHRFVLLLTLATSVLFFTFVAFFVWQPDKLSQQFGDMLPVSLGLLAALSLILVVILGTACYSIYANKRFDPQLAKLLSEYQQ